ncbi:hypothetical protein SDC9_210352 [bioreactor metagenome]|uniref:Xylose isomerase-like TIM barrel domain-containing protein n=1 Tax=bioreactor metagenome TaxID=1076179 RepID=A0A645JHM1_9ZZZZ
MVNTYVPKLKAEGITLGFHNHYAEFAPNNDGQIIYDELVNRSALSLEIDTYWAFKAGKDPIALMKKYADRLIFVHLKDGDGGMGGRALGEGIAPVKAVRKKAVEMGVPMVVESENLNPNGIDEVTRCFKYLASL